MHVSAKRRPRWWRRQRRPRAVMPEFPENRFISVATRGGQGLLTDMISLRSQKTEHVILRLSDPAGVPFQTPWFAPPLGTANDDDDGFPGRTPFYKRQWPRPLEANWRRRAGGAPASEKIMTSLRWGNFERRRGRGGYRSWQVAPRRSAATWGARGSHHISILQLFIAFSGSYAMQNSLYQCFLGMTCLNPMSNVTLSIFVLLCFAESVC